MKPCLLLIITLLLFCYHVSAQTVESYSITKKYGNVKLTEKDLKEIVAIIQNYHNQLVQENPLRKDSLEFSLELTNHYSDKITCTTFKQAEKIVLKHSYINLDLRYDEMNNQTNRLNIYLRNQSRELYVNASSKTKTVNLFKQVNDVIKPRGTKLYAMNWELYINFFYMISNLTVARCMGKLWTKIRKRERTALSVVALILCVGYVVLMFFTIFTIFLSTLFSRVATMPDSFSLLDLAVNVTGVLALPISLSALIYVCYKWIKMLLRNADFNQTPA